MKYLCLIYGDEIQRGKLPKAEVEAFIGEHLALTASLQGSGRYLGAAPLQPTGSASTVRVREGRLSVTDGPFAETKEQLLGYYLIEASDLDDAIHVASRIPNARSGCIEVRPVAEMPPR
jgi:hypothetical protein